ncbi:hypothetical protein P3342_010632 [Pyrenophora teres f. teres]|nr:hypothetical protein P3342_010632 [Pyrenophora teres f. teres]
MCVQVPASPRLATILAIAAFSSQSSVKVCVIVYLSDQPKPKSPHMQARLRPRKLSLDHQKAHHLRDCRFFLQAIAMLPLRLYPRHLSIHSTNTVLVFSRTALTTGREGISGIAVRRATNTASPARRNVIQNRGCIASVLFLEGLIVYIVQHRELSTFGGRGVVHSVQA